MKLLFIFANVEYKRNGGKNLKAQVQVQKKAQQEPGESSPPAPHPT